MKGKPEVIEVLAKMLKEEAGSHQPVFHPCGDVRDLGL